MTGLFEPDSIGAYRWQDLRVPIISQHRTGTSDGTLTKIVGKGASVGVWALAFSGSQLDEVYFTAQLPHGIQGSTIDCHVHWMTPAAIPAGQSVIVGCEYMVNGYGEVLATQSVILSQTLNAGYASNTHLIVELGTIPIPARRDSAVIIGRLYRDGSGDSYNSAVFLTDCDFHFQVGSTGSLDRYGDR
jgi:hypothetical protein